MFLFHPIPEHPRPLLGNVRKQNTKSISKCWKISIHIMNSFNLCEIIMYIQIAIYWWCFGFETYVKICGGIQLWGENRLCLFFSETKKQKWNIFHPTNECFYVFTKNWYNFLSPRQMQFCQELVQNLHFLWFPESAHLSGGFVKKKCQKC